MRRPDLILRWRRRAVIAARRRLGGILDPHHYLQSNADVRDSGTDAALHFLTYGAPENRPPHPWFSPAYVRTSHPHEAFTTRTEAEVYRDSALPRRPRLIFVSHDATRTGAPAIILRLLEMFSETGAFECFTLLDQAGERFDEFAALSHAFVMPWSRFDRSRDPALRRALARQILSPDGPFGANPPLCALVNSAESHQLCEALSASGVPVVSLLHECADFYPPARFEDFVSWSREVIFPSHFVRDTAIRYARFDAARTRVRGQGLLEDGFGALDRASCRALLRRRQGLPEEARIVLNVGTADARKGIDLFLRAALRFLQTRPEDQTTHFLWFGHGIEQAGGLLRRTRAEMRRLGLGDRIRLLPPTDRIEEVFMSGDIFLLTARADPFPCVVHEAMACGLPVIAFRDGGGAQELIGAECGALADMGDTRQMADVLGQLLDDPERHAAMAAAARQKIARDWTFRAYFEDIARTMQRHARGTRPWPALPQPRPAGHLFVLEATAAAAQALAARLAQDAPPRFEVAVLDGRFGAGIADCVARLKAAGIPHRILQPQDGSAQARSRLLHAVLLKPRPLAATLVDTLHHAQPERLALLGYPVDAILTGAALPETVILRALPALGRIDCAGPAARQRLSEIAPELLA